MKKALLLLKPILSSFKWYRKRMGGNWFKMFDVHSGGGFEGSPCFWTQDPGKYEGEVIKKEVYPFRTGQVINLKEYGHS